MDKLSLLSHIGTIPKEQGLKAKLRFHQGWWRTFVLNAPEGANPVSGGGQVCNTISDGITSKNNFLTPAAWKSVEDTLLERKVFGAGSFNTNRLYNNLLSSQPLAFNFFGSLKQDLSFATKVLSAFIPEVTPFLYEQTLYFTRALGS